MHAKAKLSKKRPHLSRGGHAMLNHLTSYGQRIPKGDERILFIDDEPELLKVGVRMLGMLGYSVVAMANGIDALEAFRLEPDGFDLVITDQNMPRMTGVELAGQLQKIRPDIPVIMYTGLLDANQPDTLDFSGFREVLIKPVFLLDLALSIRRVLEGVHSETPD